MTTVETVAEPRGSAWTSPARTILLALIGALLVVAIAVAAIGTALDNGHAQLHAGTAAFVLLLAGLLAWRSAISGLLTAIPAIGLAVLAVPMLIEATGALGYDPVTQARTSELANLHDVGLAITSLGMLALVIGIAVPVGMLLDRRTRLPGWVAAGVAVAITVLGLLGIKLVAGM